MPQTTTAIISNNVVVRLADANDTLRDISGSSNKCEMNLQNMVGEGRTFGSLWPFRVVGGKDADIKFDFFYTEADNEARDVVHEWFFGGDDSPRRMEIDVPDSSVGSHRYKGTFVLEGAPMPFDASSPDPVKTSASLKISGALTREEIQS